MKNTLSILLKNFFTLVMVLMILLACFSYFEIVCKNVNPNPTYSSWNILVNLAKTK